MLKIVWILGLQGMQRANLVCVCDHYQSRRGKLKLVDKESSDPDVNSDVNTNKLIALQHDHHDIF